MQVYTAEGSGLVWEKTTDEAPPVGYYYKNFQGLAFLHPNTEKPLKLETEKNKRILSV